MPFLIERHFDMILLRDYRFIQDIQEALLAPFPAPVAVVVALKPTSKLLTVVTLLIVISFNLLFVKNV